MSAKCLLQWSVVERQKEQIGVTPDLDRLIALLERLCSSGKDGCLQHTWAKVARARVGALLNRPL